MIARYCLLSVLTLINWILNQLGIAIAFPSGVTNTVIYFICYIFDNGAGMLFYFIRPETFYNCVTLVFTFWLFEPVYIFILWALRKIPFFSIN